MDIFLFIEIVILLEFPDHVILVIDLFLNVSCQCKDVKITREGNEINKSTFPIVFCHRISISFQNYFHWSDVLLFIELLTNRNFNINI